MNDKPNERAVHDSDVAPRSHTSQVPPHGDELLLVNVRRAPGDEANWEAIDEDARANDTPERGEAAYAEALARPDLEPAALQLVGERYVAFLEEWYEDPEKPITVLRTVLRRDPQNRAALEKLTLLLTLGERWDELLATYDETLEHSTDTQQRIALLDEAARIAKDFAGQAQRASDYLKRLLELKPRDATLAQALERRLEQQERHQDLVDIWEIRLGVVDAAAALNLRIGIGDRYLQHLRNAPKALETARALFEVPRGAAPACELLEKLAASDTADLPSRREALRLLAEHYADTERVADVVRVLTQALVLAESHAERVALNQQLVTWNINNKDELAAQYAAAEWLALAPSNADALQRLQALAEATGDFEHEAEAVVRAADGANTSAERAELRLLAADKHTTKSGNTARAKELYAAVLSDTSATASQQLRAARALTSLLVDASEIPARLDVLERLAELEGEQAARRAALAEAAVLAERTQDDTRALRLWSECLRLDAADAAAHDARIAILTRLDALDDLLLALRARYAQGQDDAARRADLVQSAKIHLRRQDLTRTVTAWQEIENVFGRDDETVDALIDALKQAERFAELVTLLEDSERSESNVQRRADQLALLGDVFRERLLRPDAAVTRYRAALTLLPNFERAREGAHALLNEETARLAAAEALADAYRTAGEWSQLLSLVEVRFSTAPGLAERQSILLEAAQTAEARERDLPRALAYLARAFALSADVEVETDLHRLAELTGDWETVVEGYARALEYSSDGARNLELLLAQGEVYEHKLQQWPPALSAYRRTLSIQPGHVEGARSTVRAAAETGDWDVACWALLTSAAANEGLAEELVLSFERAASAGDGLRWVSALESLTQATLAAGLAPRVSHDVKFQLATWLWQRTQARGSAIDILRGAVDEHRAAPSLTALVELQRSSPSAALVESLLKLADIVAEPLPHLYEAAAVALDPIADTRLARPILERALTRAESLLAGSAGNDEAARVAAWAVAQLVVIATENHEPRVAYQLLTRGAKLPLDTELVLRLQHDAALIASRELGEPERAIELCRNVLSVAKDRTETIALLADLYEREGRLEPLIALRRGELELTPARARRLELRLELSRVLGLIESNDEQRLETLQDNLKEAPGHAETIDAIATLLVPDDEFERLYAILMDQADAVTQHGDGASAAQLFARAGELADVSLGDVEKALVAYRSSVALQPSTAVLDALAAIHTARKEHSESTAWLKQRYALTNPDESAAREETLVRLGRSLREDGKPEEGITYLEAGLREDPAATQVRELLAELREERREWLEFATLLAEGVAFAADAETKVRYLRRAADIWWHQLDELETAVPLLERAHALEPHDHALRLALGEGLRLTGNLERARELLSGLLEEYGRRRTPERAKVHYQLALIDRSQERLSEALEQLDAASSINRSDPIVLKTLGDVAAQNNELERAERAFRALLLLVGRSQGTDATIGASAILFDLYRIAIARDDQARAKDLLDSALQAAEQDPIEAKRLERALFEAERWELLSDALARRAARVQDEGERREIVRLQTDVWVRTGRSAEALDAVLTEALNTSDEGLFERAQDIAERNGLTDRLVQALTPAAESAEAAAPDRAARLWLRLGHLTERLGDAETAGRHFARAQATGFHPEESFQSLKRVHGVTADVRALISSLERYVAADPALVDVERQNSARYELAELRLANPQQLGQGVEALEAALDVAPDYARAATALRAALSRSGMNTQLCDLVEIVARTQGDQPLLLQALSFAASQPSTSLDQLREATRLAQGLGETDTAQRLLRRTLEFARQAGQLPNVIDVSVLLAQQAASNGRVPEAIELLEEASQQAAELQRRDLELELARLLRLDPRSRERAMQLYESLAKQEPSDERAWAPLLELCRETGDKEALQAALSRAEKHVVVEGQRRALQLERVRLLLDANRLEDAESALRTILEDEPENVSASDLLCELLESSGRGDEVRQLLEQQLEAAIARGDEASVVRYALHLGRILESDDAEAAIRVYRMANASARRNRALLDALLKLLPEDEPRERADVLESLLPMEGPGAAEEVALQLANLRSELGDEAGIERAYEVGFGANPKSRVLRDLLEQWYRDREHWAPLADLYAVDAEHRDDSEEALSQFLAAAHIYDERLGDAAGAGKIMDRAVDRVGPTPEVLERFSTYWVTAGDPDHALALLNRVLSEDLPKAEEHALVLHLRGAVLARSGEHDPGAIQLALSDLERALQLGRSQVHEDLVALLERQLQLAQLRGDDDLERATLVRLAAELPRLGHAPHSLGLLGQWVEKHPEDVELGMLRAELTFDSGDYEAAARAFLSVFHAATGPARKQAALRYARACQAFGEPLAARGVLHQLYQEDPADAETGNFLKQLYEEAGAYEELADLLLRKAEATPALTERHGLLLEAARMLLRVEPVLPRSVEIFESALALQPEDHPTIVGLAEAYTRTGNIEQACVLLEGAIKGHGKRRSRELSELQHAMSIVAQHAGDDEGRFAWLDAALQSDRRNGQVAAELAIFAMDRGDQENAIKALQLITLLKEDCSMSRAEAYLRQAIISQQRADLKKAALLAKRALATDPEYEPAKAFLNEIGPQ